MPQQLVVYGNAEARGKVRAWKTQLHKKYQIFDQATVPTNHMALL
jgi:hypothetical protein